MSDSEVELERYVFEVAWEVANKGKSNALSCMQVVLFSKPQLFGDVVSWARPYTTGNRKQPTFDRNVTTILCLIYYNCFDLNC